MKKFILYAGMAFILSFYAAANIEAGSSGFNVSIDSADPCAGGAVDSTYIFTARSGSDKQITMARRPVALESEHDAGDHSNHGDDYRSTDWFYYDLPIFTKSQVQAGYYLESDGDLVLVVVYSADKEGKSGAIVSRISTDYGKTWSESKNVTNNQHKFGLAVAPSSLFVAIHNDNKINMHWYASEGVWETLPGKVHQTAQTNGYKGLDSSGFSVVYHDCFGDTDGSGSPTPTNRALIGNTARILLHQDTPLGEDSGDGPDYITEAEDDGSQRVSVTYIDDCKCLSTRDYLIDKKGWKAPENNLTDDYESDTAWLYDEELDKFYLAAKKKDVNKIGIYSTNGYRVTKFKNPFTGKVQTDTAYGMYYNAFNDWVNGGGLHISGMWKCPDTNTKYILSTDNNNISSIYGISNDGVKIAVYTSNHSSSMQSRVSMFNVPAK